LGWEELMIATMLIENMKCPADDELISENSLSMHIMHDGHSVIFDMGASNKCLKNARKMGIDLENVDAVVISHGHKDHVGALRKFLEINKKAKVYIREEAFEDHCLDYRLFRRDIGIDRGILDEHGDRLVFVEGHAEILPGFYVFSDFSNKYEIFDFNKVYLKKENGNNVNDDFHHEQVLVLKMEKGLIIFSGCSHSGILNVLEAVHQKLPNTKVKAIMGGLHLVAIPLFMEVSERDIMDVGKGILSYEVGISYICHCTSRRGYRILKKAMGGKVAYFFTGSQVEI